MSGSFDAQRIEFRAPFCIRYHTSAGNTEDGGKIMSGLHHGTTLQLEAVFAKLKAPLVAIPWQVIRKI
jgi:hypothetical protein